MNRFGTWGPVLVAAVVITASEATAQGWRLRLDTRVQAVSYRGVELDTVPRAALDPGPAPTADGFAVFCITGDTLCTFFRPGPERHGGPLVTTADVAAWGLGVAGVSVHAAARIGTDLGDVDLWPGNDPAIQLLEAYAAYATDRVSARAGRIHEVTRFGFVGFDGARVAVRPIRDVSVTAYGGWGLARGVALPVTSPALNPLDDFQPRDRQLVVGGDATVRLPWLTGRVLYQREVDPGIDAFVSERVGTDVLLRPVPGLAVTGGADWDLAQGWLGSAEGSVRYTPAGRWIDVSAGGRRYRPHFPLWTIWGAFSPVPYRAGFGRVTVRPTAGVEVHVRGEIYAYDDAEVLTPLVTVEDDGWRWGWSASWEVREDWVATGGFHADFGPGGSSRGFEGAVTWLPRRGTRVTLHAAELLRPLELRFAEAQVRLIGLDGEMEFTDRLAVTAAALRYDETRDRPDAAAFDWDQFRLSAGLRLAFGSPIARAAIPPAILRIPEGAR